MKFKFNIFIFCLLVSYLYPLHLPIWTTFHSEFVAFLGLGILSLEKICLDKKLIKNISLIFIVISIISYLNKTYCGDYVLFIIYTFGCLIAYGYGFQGERNSEFKILNSLFFMFIVAGFLTAVVVFSQIFNTEYVGVGYILNLNSGRPFGNLAQPNQAATLLVMGWLSLCYQFEKGAVRKYIFIMGSALLLVAVVLTQSRTALLSMCVITFSAIFLINNFRLNKLSKLNITGWLVMLIMYILATLLFHFLPAFSENSIGLSAMASTGTRFSIWSQIFFGLMESPWIGHGLLQASSAQQLGSYKIPGSEQTNYSHNLILDLLVWFGIPVGLFLVIGVFFCIFSLWRRNPRPENAWLLIFLIPFLVHSMLEMPFVYAYFLFPIFVILGCIASSPKEASLTEIDKIKSATVGCKYNLFFDWVGSLVSVLFVLMSSIVTLDYIKIEEDFRIVRFENLKIGKTPVDYKKPEIFFLNQLEELMDAMRLRAKPNMSINDVELLKRASLRHPWAPLHFRLTLALALNKEPDLAAKQLHLMFNYFGPDIYEESISNLIDLQITAYPELGETLRLIDIKNLCKTPPSACVQ